jgi:hypothetical protein
MQAPRVIRHYEASPHPVTVFESYEDALRRIDGGEWWESERERILRSFGPSRRVKLIVYRAAYLSGKYD